MSSPLDPIQLAREARSLGAVETVLAATPADCLLDVADALLRDGGFGPSAFAVWERVTKALLRDAPDAALAGWLEAEAADGGPGRLWARARIRTRLDPSAARSDWDAVIDKEVGPRAQRYCGRARHLLSEGHAEAAWSDLREAFRDPATHADMEKGAKLLRKLRAHPMPANRNVKIGLLGAFTTQLIRPLLELACYRDGIDAEIYESEYGVFRQEVLDPTSGLRRFEPDVVIFATSHREAALPPVVEDPDAAVDRLVADQVALWRVCNDELRAHVIQHDFDLPLVDSMGHLSRVHGSGRNRVLQRANEALRAAAPAGVSVLDFDGVAAEFGKERWFDASLWYLAKQHPAPAALPTLVDAYAMHLRALFGLTKKVLALDLDNTTWGGIVGEDGVDGIEVGGHSPVGEAHQALQAYAKELRERGVVLTVCSKNNDADAREPFERHPEMLLRLDDIAVFKANWQDKATNLRETAEALGLGLDSFVFLDDNPTERAWVRNQLPEVAVPEIGNDPSRYLEILQRHHYFDSLTLSEEDRLRAADYAANARRAELEQSATTMEEFLASLDMSAQVERFDELNLPRITQLVNKSNQFNLTTQRHTREQLAAFAESGAHVARAFRLKDRFADNGLVGVMIGHHEDGDATLVIDLWLMSCRVLGRRMEELMCGVLMEAARERGATRVEGRYLPTAKNAMVSDLYPRLGFESLGEGPADGETRWLYDLETQPLLGNDFIRIEAS